MFWYEYDGYAFGIASFSCIAEKKQKKTAMRRELYSSIINGVIIVVNLSNAYHAICCYN